MIWHIGCDDGYFPDGPAQFLHIELPKSPRKRFLPAGNVEIERLSFGRRAVGLSSSHFGGRAVPVVDTSSTDSFGPNDDAAILSFVTRLPLADRFVLRRVPEGIILADQQDFTEAAFDNLPNAIHIKVSGEIVVRFPPRGAHEFYDFFRTLGTLFALERFLHSKYQIHAVSDVTFGYTLLEPRYPNFLPRPTYEGQFRQNVAAHSFDEDVEDAVMVCLRTGGNVAIDRAEVKDALREVWFREFDPLFRRG